MQESVTATCWFLSITRNIENALSAFALDVGKAEVPSQNVKQWANPVHVS